MPIFERACWLVRWSHETTIQPIVESAVIVNFKGILIVQVVIAAVTQFNAVFSNYLRKAHFKRVVECVA